LSHLKTLSTLPEQSGFIDKHNRVGDFQHAPSAMPLIIQQAAGYRAVALPLTLSATNVMNENLFAMW